jgi:hypothetical protein
MVLLLAACWLLARMLAAGLAAGRWLLLIFLIVHMDLGNKFPITWQKPSSDTKENYAYFKRLHPKSRSNKFSKFESPKGVRMSFKCPIGNTVNTITGQW